MILIKTQKGHLEDLNITLILSNFTKKLPYNYKTLAPRELANFAAE